MCHCFPPILVSLVLTSKPYACTNIETFDRSTRNKESLSLHHKCGLIFSWLIRYPKCSIFMISYHGAVGRVDNLRNLTQIIYLVDILMYHGRLLILMKMAKLKKDADQNFQVFDLLTLVYFRSL